MPIPDKTIYGQNVKVKVFLDGTPKGGPELATSCKITQVSTQHSRNYLGRKRRVTDKHVDGYDLALKMDFKNSELMDALRARDDARDANTSVPDLTVVVEMTLRNGREVVYAFTGCEDKVDIDAGDRTKEVEFNLELACEDCNKVQ